MLDSFTLYFASIAVMTVMTLLNFLTWRTNKHVPGTLLYISYPLLLLAAIVGFAVSWVWWGPLFGKQWMKLSGMTKQELDKAKQKGMGGSLTIAFIANLIMAYVLAALILATGASTLMDGVMLGFWVWLGFVATIGVGAVLWQNKSWGLFWLNNLGWLVTIALMSAVLVVWG